MKPYYEKHPGLAKRDTLFLHGNLASSAWWQPTLIEWKNSGSLGPGALYFSDWRGCGQNADWPIDKIFTIRELAEDQLQLLEELTTGEVSVVAHSLGGLIALQMMILAPKKIKSAVLLDSVGLKGIVFDESMYEAFKQMAASPDLTKFVILSTIHKAAELPDGLTDKLAADAYKAVKGIGSSVLQILKTVDIEKEAAKISTKVLFMHGRHDEIIPIGDSQKAAKILPNAELEILPDAGHCWNVENSAKFTQRLREWL